MSERIIYLVYTCDFKMSRDSMQLVLATTSVRRVKSFVSQGILNCRWSYRDHQGYNEKDQAKLFRKDFERTTRGDLNDMLLYCYLDYIYDGEEIWNEE